MSDKPDGKRKRRRLYEEEPPASPAKDPEPTAEDSEEDQPQPQREAVATEVVAPIATGPARELTPIRKLESRRTASERGVIEGYVVVSTRTRAEAPEAGYQEQSAVYEITYDEERIRGIVTDVLGGGAVAMGRMSLLPLRFVPVFGKIVRRAIEPAMEQTFRAFLPVSRSSGDPGRRNT